MRGPRSPTDTLTAAWRTAPERGDTLTGRDKTSEAGHEGQLGHSAPPGLTSSTRRLSLGGPSPSRPLRTPPPTAFACCYSPPAKSSPSPQLARPKRRLTRIPPREKLLEGGGPGGAMAEEKESTSIPLSQAAEAVDPEDPAKSPPRPSSPTTSTRKVRI